MYNVILVFLPLAFLIVMAVATKRMAESIVAALTIAMIILYKGNFIHGMLDAFYGTLSNPSYQFVLLILIGFGAFIQLLQSSGAMVGFKNVLLKVASTPKKSMVMAWIMTFLLFADEFLDSITVAFAMRDITDNHGIPREHLAFHVHSMACCLAMTIPFSSWTGFTLGLVEDFGIGFTDYVKSIPFMLFPLLMIVLCLLLALGLFPKIGELKKSYERVQNGGPALYVAENEEVLAGFEDIDPNKEAPAWTAIIPLIGLVVGVMISDYDLLYGLVIALILQFILYIALKIMTVRTFFDEFFNGAKSMITIAIILCFGFTFSQANRDLGMFEIITSAVGNHVSAAYVPVLAFLIVGFLTFAVGSCWVVMTIVMPIFVPLAISMGVSATLIIAAIMSGVALGYCTCYYAEAVFVATAGTGVSNIRIINSTMPYGIILGVISAVWFLVLGIFGA